MIGASKLQLELQGSVLFVEQLTVTVLVQGLQLMLAFLQTQAE
jgi:hypothetical protein